MREITDLSSEDFQNVNPEEYARLRTIYFQTIFKKILGKFKLYFGIILVVFLFASCKGTYKSNKLAKEQFKNIIFQKHYQKMSGA
jgi:hypothetical protein